MQKDISKKLLEKKNLDAKEIEILFEGIMEKIFSEIEIASLLSLLSAKGFSAQEVAGAAKVLMKKAKSFKSENAFDNCGTGGSGLPRFNISTAAAFVLSAGGIKVAKHGNRGMGGRTGSFDIIEKLRIRFDFSPKEAEEILEKHNLIFLFAPAFHPAMGNVAPIRKELGFKTIFNILGPLLNPAKTQTQMVGTSSLGDAEKISEALKILGREKYMVVFGDGLDEITISGKTDIFEFNNGNLKKYQITPEDFGIKKVSFDKITGGGTRENTEKTELILRGEDTSEITEMVALNAGAGFYIYGISESILEGYKKAKEIIKSGVGYEKLEEMRKI